MQARIDLHECIYALTVVINGPSCCGYHRCPLGNVSFASPSLLDPHFLPLRTVQ